MLSRSERDHVIIAKAITTTFEEPLEDEDPMQQRVVWRVVTWTMLSLGCDVIGRALFGSSAPTKLVSS